ncbi:MAG: protoheme IX farnesyltransferase [Bacteroidia bacterium]|nr:protoheme IX farnesyltransferase [Bacteroidia bacterium]MDW8235849.1 protoheme IX farnesyltransferase [Bacteroidia bacterium]
MKMTTSQSLSLLPKIGLYFALTKPRLSVVVVFSALMGALIAGVKDVQSLLWLILGGYAIAGSANAANQYQERHLDALMERTRHRPLPAGLLAPHEGIFVSLFLLVAGITMLSLIHLQVAAIAVGAWFIYVFLYTPLKRTGQIAVAIGAISGALPPVIGYWAGTPTFTPTLLLLFLLQFLWQYPHFWVIAWMNRSDYSRVGFHLLPFPEHNWSHNRTAILAGVILLCAASILSLLWFPLSITLWIGSVGTILLIFSFYWLMRRSTPCLRCTLLGLTGYLTLLYLGLWILL